MGLFEAKKIAENYFKEITPKYIYMGGRKLIAVKGNEAIIVDNLFIEPGVLIFECKIINSNVSIKLVQS